MIQSSCRLLENRQVEHGAIPQDSIGHFLSVEARVGVPKDQPQTCQGMATLALLYWLVPIFGVN
jgi:hypothetical protein